MTTVNLATREDFELFKQDVLAEVTRLIAERLNDTTQNDWLRSSEVLEKLNISSATLHNLRKNGTISYSKIGSIYYHKREDILKILDSHPSKS
jgi:hypothetical protein